MVDASILEGRGILFQRPSLDLCLGSSKSLVHGTHCFVLVGLSKLFCSQAIAAEKELGATRANERYWIAIRNTSIPISLIITLIWGATRKDWATGLWDVSAVDPFLLGFNMITSTAAIFTGGSLVVFSFAGDSSDQQDRFQPTPLLCSLAVGLISTLVPYPAVVTPLQLTAFITAIVCLAWPDISSEVSSLKNQDDAELKGLEQGWRTNLTALTFNRVVAAARYFALLCLGMLCLSSAWQSTTRTAPPSPETVSGLDCAYQPPSEMDIVVSMYKEPLSVVGSTVAALRDIPSIGALSPRAHIYVKDADADVEAIRNATGAHAVTVLPNVGREGHTYLHHALARWDRLARHTLFIQAEPHDFANALRRIREYYVPAATGMLSLGSPGISCDCGGDSTTCGDPHWRDTSNTIGSVYERVHNSPHNNRTTCSRALLSYRGQFIASAARLRAADRALLGELAATLASPASWALRAEFQFDVRENTPQAPQFGYTVERLWAVLLRCADPEAATRCPALHAGRPRWGADGDCQCLDDGACAAGAGAGAVS
ncbi:hypothetical protein SLS58_000974 [Diplodia intermedia]|uniref:Uncharacterized protein n=1 Tax=Diplodia intermedia TaxID=856260 RepID=A0ABR3U3Q3_9PEZI